MNTDKDAPIFEAADYGIVGDVQKVLPALISAIKEEDRSLKVALSTSYMGEHPGGGSYRSINITLH